MSLVSGTRCRSARAIVFAGGVIPLATPGTLVSRRENLGRELFTGDFDSGEKVILFAHEIEVCVRLTRDPAKFGQAGRIESEGAKRQDTAGPRDGDLGGRLRRDPPTRGERHWRSPDSRRVQDEAGRLAGASPEAPRDAAAENPLAVEGRAHRLPLRRPVQLRLPLRGR